MKRPAWMAVATLVAVLGPGPGARAVGADGVATESGMQIVDAAQMLPFANLVNEVSPRRRRSVLVPNAVAMFDGVLADFVQTGAGNLSLRRRDLVAVALSPLVLGRVYDSRADAGRGGDFGVGGWRLSLASRIRVAGDVAEYVNDAGATLALRRVGARLVPLRTAPRPFVAIDFVGERHIEITMRSGARRLFERLRPGADFVLLRVVDRFGNVRRYDYDGADRLVRVTSGPRQFRFLRNAAGAISEVHDDAGRTLRYHYDQAGRLVTAIDAGGHPWHYQYDRHGRLSDATAPGGQRDLGVTYDASGKVRVVIRNGLVQRYDYDVQAGQPPDLTVTRVTDSAGAERLFGHNRDGVTVWVQNAAGQRSRLWLGADNQPRLLQVDGRDSMRLRYDDDGRLTQVLRPGAGASRSVRVRYAADGRPAELHDADGGLLAAIERAGDTGVRVTGPGLHRRIEVAADGALRTAEFAPATPLTFVTSAAGQLVRVSDHQGRSMAFEYFPAGTLAAATFPDGERHAYRYDALGLRTATAISSGASVRYYYAPEGRIYRYEMTAPDGQRVVTTHEFDSQQRLLAMRQDDDVIRLRYRDDGALAAYAPPGAELRFDYDALGRLTGTTLARETWRYLYRPDETDLVMRAERRRAPPAFAPHYAGDALADIYPVLYLRRLPASHGTLTLDMRTGTFELTHEFGVPLPGDDLRHALRAVGVLDAEFEPALFAPGADPRSAFNAPSNFFFVPPEYWALNCIVCPGSYPRPAPGGRAAPPLWPSLEDASAALQYTCYLFPYTVPEPTCLVLVSGVPEYLCMGDVMDIGASLVPASLGADNLEWTTNDFLQVQPVGATGTPVSIRGVPGTPTVTSGVGRLNGVYTDGGLSCVSHTMTLNVIAEKARNYTQLTDLDMCPERQQDTSVAHRIDGCSIPPLVGDIAFSGDIQDPVGGTRHAPDRATTFGLDQGSVPYGGPVAPLPCNLHDQCYQTCGRNRRGCDDAFDDAMSSVCELAYPTDCPYAAGSPDCVAFEQEKTNCALVRTLVYQGVRVAGAPSYRQRQVQHCRCCP